MGAGTGAGPGTNLGAATDEDLVVRYHQGDRRAVEELLDRYRNFTRLKARSYFLAGADKDDIIQEGMIGLYKAIRDFDPAHETAFRAFAEILSDFEAEVLHMYVEGKSYQEIADHLGRHQKSIDNALQRIKRKVELHLKERQGDESAEPTAVGG
jgi:DNA-directed RNA polymerase specialized sigma24 family protein